jgi:hypothetical protein
VPSVTTMMSASVDPSLAATRIPRSDLSVAHCVFYVDTFNAAFTIMLPIVPFPSEHYL